MKLLTKSFSPILMRMLSFILFQTCVLISWAQCAMCKTQIQNNVNNGETDLATELNAGILFLLSAPYVALMVLALLWYKYKRRTKYF